MFYRKVTPPGMNDYLMDHTSLIYLMGPDGKYLDQFQPRNAARQNRGAAAPSLIALEAD